MTSSREPVLLAFIVCVVTRSAPPLLSVDVEHAKGALVMAMHAGAKSEC